MQLIRRINKNAEYQWEYITQLKRDGMIQRPEEIKSGRYYLYKEKHGMVALVKLVKKIANDGWVDFTLLVKRVLFSPFEVSKGTVFKVGLDVNYSNYPGSWHFEPGMAVIKCTAPGSTPLDEIQKGYCPERDQNTADESVS